ncbi:unnamed protein product [Arctogadus glacialis]
MCSFEHNESRALRPPCKALAIEKIMNLIGAGIDTSSSEQNRAAEAEHRVVCPSGCGRSTASWRAARFVLRVGASPSSAPTPPTPPIATAVAAVTLAVCTSCCVADVVYLGVCTSRCVADGV